MKKLLFLFLLFPMFCFAAEKVDVRVTFTEEVQTKSGKIKYTDALYYPLDKWQEVKQADIDKVKAERVANFKNAVDNPPKEAEPTKEQLEEQKRQMEESKASLEAQIAELTTKIDSKEVEVKEDIK